MRAGAALLVLLLAGSCAPSLPARPALWRVADGDTVIWMLGSIHVLPRTVDWQTKAVRYAIDHADTLVVEIPNDPEAAHAAFDRVSHASRLPPLADRVSASDRPKLKAAADAAGITLASLDGLKTWAAALALSTQAAAADGADAEHGVEAVLDRRFATRRRTAFETAPGQFAIFDAMPETDQRALLVEAITTDDDYPATLAAWRTGNVTQLARLTQAYGTAPGVEAALVTNRNARFTAAIVRRLARPGRVLVAVGAGHLVGPRSVVAMLRARGLRVDRIE